MDSGKNKAYLNWSGGKDCCLALYQCLAGKEQRIDKLVTTCNASHDRISMHGVRTALLEAQAGALGIPLHPIMLPGEVSMEEYNNVMRQHVQQLVAEGFDTAVFGDIFLEDLRAYREQQLALCGMKAVFPLWKQDTARIAERFIDLGFKAKIVCVNAGYLGRSFAGRDFDAQFLSDLPANVDPCGENGEFHTFVYDGPIFKAPVKFNAGETVFRQYETRKDSNEDECFSSQPVLYDTGFWYADLLSI